MNQLAALHYPQLKTFEPTWMAFHTSNIRVAKDSTECPSVQPLQSE